MAGTDQRPALELLQSSPMWGACVVFFGVWASLLVGWDVCFSRLPNVLTYTGYAEAIVVAVAAGDP